MTNPLPPEEPRTPEEEEAMLLFKEMSSAQAAGHLTQDEWEKLLHRAVRAETDEQMQKVRDKFEEKINAMER